MINPFKSKKGLGRGLSSLIGDSEKIDDKKKVSISSLVRNKYQPRKKFDEISLEELTNSIRERGIIQPIIVRPSSEEEDKFKLYSLNKSENSVILPLLWLAITISPSKIFDTIIANSLRHFFVFL